MTIFLLRWCGCFCEKSEVVFVFYCRFACYETFGMNARRLDLAAMEINLLIFSLWKELYNK